MAYDLAHAVSRMPSFMSRVEAGQLSNPPDPFTVRELSRAISLPQLDMLRAMGHLEDEDVAACERGDVAIAIERLRPILDQIT